MSPTRLFLIPARFPFRAVVERTHAMVPGQPASSRLAHAEGKLRSAAVEMPVRDQPSAWAMGCRKTPSENIAPNPTQVTTIAVPTMTQP